MDDGSGGCLGQLPGATAQGLNRAYIDLSIGDAHVCAITASKQVECWGHLGIVGPYVAPKGTTCGPVIEKGSGEDGLQGYEVF